MEKDQIKKTLQELKPVIGAKADKIWKLYMLSDTGEDKAEIAQIVKLLADKHLNNFDIEQINLIPPKEPQKNAQYKVGDIVYGTDGKIQSEFTLNDKDFMRHIGIFGTTGSGKTTVCYNLLKNLVDNDKPFLILDWKRDYRELLNRPEFKKKVLVFTVGRDASPFRFNPKEKPPGVEDYIWQKVLMQVISHAYFLGHGALDTLQDIMHLENFHEMHNHLKKQKKQARELLWWASAKRTLNAINYPGLAEVVNSKSFNIPDLLEKQVILELDGLSDTDKIFLIGTMMMWVYYYRLSQPDREKWKHTIFLEEAHHLLLKQPNSQPENYADMLMREVRVFGQAIVVIDQRPSRLSDSALANINTKICLNLNHSQDTTAMSKALLLDQPNYIGMLKVGQAICKTQKTTFPFYTLLPDFPLNKGSVSDNDIKELMKQYPEFSTPKKITIANSRRIQSFPEDETPPSPVAKILLQNIAEKPFLPVSQRYKTLGLSNAQGNAIQQELVEKGFAEPHTVDGLKLLALTPKSTALTKKWKVGAYNPRGGIEHNYWLDKIREFYNANDGFTFNEKDNIDLVVVGLKDADEKITAIQVETGKSNISKNIKTLDAYQADTKLMIATNKETVVKIKSLINSKSSIQVLFVKDFLKNQKSKN